MVFTRGQYQCPCPAPCRADLLLAQHQAGNELEDDQPWVVAQAIHAMPRMRLGRSDGCEIWDLTIKKCGNSSIYIIIGHMFVLLN